MSYASLKGLRGLARMGGLGAGAALLTRAGDSVDGKPSGSKPPQRLPAGGPARCQAAFDDSSKDAAGFVGVFLDRASVDKARSAVGVDLGQAAHALVHLHPDPATKETFAPLFGAKATVLVRGVAEDTATRQRVMIVDVSVGGPQNKMVPRTPLGHASIPTIALPSESWDDEVADLLGVDLARRLLENGVLRVQGSWDGVLPAQVIDGIKYPATRATFTQVDEPIALEGTVCASTDYDNRASKCVPTAASVSSAATVQQPEGAGRQLVAEGGVAEQGKGQEHGSGEQEERGECPLCTYMMASPCRDVFVVFKACIDKAGDTNEAADLKECEPSAADVHACINKFGLFRENIQDGGDDAEADEDQEPQGPSKGSK